MKKFAIILSGCGSPDGSEIHESVCLMLAIKQLGSDYQCFSINRNQTVVLNAINGRIINQERNMLVESARIAKGNIKELKDLNVDDYDGIILPGGSGATLNLSNFKLNKNNYNVDEELAKKLVEFRNQNKVICAVCIAPVILAKVFKNIEITVGNDEDIEKVIYSLGNTAYKTKSGEIYIDQINKIITAPFYMMTTDISIIYNEAYKVIEEALKL